VDEFFGYKSFFAVAVVLVAVLYGATTWKTPVLEPSLPPAPPASHISSATSTTVIAPFERQEPILTEPAPFSGFEYIEVTNGCGPYFEGTCVNMRSGPGKEYPVIRQLRNGVVLKVVGAVTEGEHTWYKIGFDGQIRYPERIIGDWYVAADYVRFFRDEGAHETTEGINTSSTKRIIIKRSTEMLYAYDGDVLFMQQPISAGLEFTPTPRGVFGVYKKTPSSYMQGPIPGITDQYYDLPGVPWDLYFTYQGGAIHGAYWHKNFGQPWSHGCVNLPPEQAHELYLWADLGTPVIVLD
jgi:lipoprotein-anchoring transpeptidase ErfK/SrfK